ncbi:MAG: PEP-CTERM sorting domain-containing protein [Burkholderiales bacterium]|jgi:MYXO-CTERM domain-containing protein|nr:PEP-CTERM sorting domain-containing protein [Burkholderiales bacterium]
MKTLLATTLALWAAASATAATPTGTSVFDLRVNNSANSGNRATGDIIVWGVNGVAPPSDNPGAYVYGFSGTCPVGKTCDSFTTDADWLKQRLFERDMTGLPHQYYASRPYDPALTGSWRLYLSTSANFNPNTVYQTPSLGDVGAMPFVSSMTVSGSGLTPSVTWTLPSSTPTSIDQMRVRVFDNSHPTTVESRYGDPYSFLQSDQLFQSAALGSSSYTVPTGLLSYGTHYSIAIDLNHLRADGSPVSRSTSYFDFTPIDPATLPAGVGNIALPTTTPVPTTSGLLAGPVYNFHVGDVGSDHVTFIDPVVATGFSYATGVGDPNFKTVQVASNVGDGLYEVWTWSGSTWQKTASMLAAGASFDFTAHGFAAGVDRFQIRGIEPEAGVNAFDLTGFVTGLSFVSAGSFNGTMQALTAEAVPEPATWALWLAGAGALLAWRRRQA